MSTETCQLADSKQIRRVALADVDQIIDQAKTILVTASRDMSVDIDQMRDSLESLRGVALVLQQEAIESFDTAEGSNYMFSSVRSRLSTCRVHLDRANSRAEEMRGSEKGLVKLLDATADAIEDLVEAKKKLDEAQKLSRVEAERQSGTLDEPV